MGIAKTYSAELVGLSTEIITVEVDISNGLNTFSVVGLGDRSISEAKDRISAAIKNTGYQSPKQKNQKVIISLAPADLKKEGSIFDLAMALTYLFAANEISFDADKKLFLGELSLEGNVSRVTGILPILIQAAKLGFEKVYIPKDNSAEAVLARGITVYPVSSLRDIIHELSSPGFISPLLPYEDHELIREPTKFTDMRVIRGNETAKRGLEIAAAGAHNVIMTGPPGTGKTMLAQSFCSILPPLSYEQAVEVTGIHSAAKILHHDFMAQPPFRAPHHTASYPSIVGGGAIPKPGEITLAHRGVLFLDEFPEFDRSVIEALRQPLEDRIITISRARGVVTFPAQAILVASMNPCPCGKGSNNDCICTAQALVAYKRRLSGPVLDRIDIWLAVNKIDYNMLSAKEVNSEDSASIRARVQKARDKQRARFLKYKINKLFNTELSADEINKMITIAEDGRALLAISAERFGLSGRSFHRIIKVAQTIADLSDCDVVLKDHILEALQYREKTF